ncbi:MAG: DUF4336 domain-containing protein [Bdellovibrionales bacterium]|nr:DUF4336 domain-containing protein [Bdellovibrionales bacterium]
MRKAQTGTQPDTQRMEPKFSYHAPRQLDAGLWEITGEWRTKFARRMTVIRLLDGRLVIHNAIHLRRHDLDWLKSLGTVSLIVAPNIFHTSDAGWMKTQFPDATLFVPGRKLADFKKAGHEAFDTELEFPEELANELLYLPSKGTSIQEAIFLHRPSKTLILTDLAFNMPDVYHGFEKVVMGWNKVGGRFGPTRALKWIFTKDRPALLETYRQILALDFERIIVNHGNILERNGRDELRKSVKEIFSEF